MNYSEVWQGMSKGRVGLACLLAVVPWAWSAQYIPLWAGILGVLLLLTGIALAVSAMVSSSHAVTGLISTGEQDKADGAEQDKLPVEMNETISNLQQLVGRWLGISRHARGDLQQVHDGVHEVMVETELAVVEIGNSFRDIIKKTALQIDYAVLLLKSTDEVSEQRGLASWLGLPDYIRAYEAQLQHVTMRMMEFSATFKEVATRQASMRENTIAVDELLDELRAMAKRIGTLAVDSSFHASNATIGQSAVINLADKIRAIAEEAHELTRRIRNNLESIKAEMAGTYKAVRDSSTAAQVAAEQAKADVSQLNVTMMEKTKEVEKTFHQINTLGKEIQNDINKIIIAMQFQDVTHQKLDKLKQPKLTGVIETLQDIAEETTSPLENQRAQTHDAASSKRGAATKSGEVDNNRHSELF